ncbi:M14 family zinc carboxypeptidase, partial [Rubripirellula sp.]
MHSRLKLGVGTFAKAYLFAVLQVTCCMQVLANSEDPASVLPRDKRDARITSPADFFGFRMGSRHLRHEQVCDYMKLLASESDRVALVPYATSHGGRPLFVLVITSPKNHADLAKIKKTHQELASGLRKVPRKEDHSVMYLGYGVHGDEASAMNASPLVAYHLASSLADSVVDSLDRSVFLL